MQHFVIENVLKKPERHERLIEQWIDADDPVLFLNGPENEIFFRPMFSAPAPCHLVTAKRPRKYRAFSLIENLAQIEIVSFVMQIQLPLHRQPEVRQFALGLDLVFLAMTTDSREYDRVDDNI